MSSKDKLGKFLFDMWMEKHHPHFYLIVGFVYFLLGLTAIAAVILSWWFPWWWKLLLLSIGLMMVEKYFVRIILSVYVDEFKAK